MLFHSFSSQDERREFGGGDFLEFTFCKLRRGTSIKKIISDSEIASLHWSCASVYLCGEDWEVFRDAYGEIITGGTYANLETGSLDCCGINYFSPEQMKQIMKKIREEKPKDCQMLLNWLEQGTRYNGFYVLGL